MIGNLLTAAKILLAKYWKLDKVTINNNMLMEKLTAIRRYRVGKLTAIMVYEKRWGKFITYWNLIEQDISHQILMLLK